MLVHAWVLVCAHMHARIHTHIHRQTHTHTHTHTACTLCPSVHNFFLSFYSSLHPFWCSMLCTNGDFQRLASSGISCWKSDLIFFFFICGKVVCELHDMASHMDWRPHAMWNLVSHTQKLYLFCDPYSSPISTFSVATNYSPTHVLTLQDHYWRTGFMYICTEYVTPSNNHSAGCELAEY